MLGFPYNSVWEYLEEVGVLDQDDKSIKEAKKEYRRRYNRHLKQEQRRKRKEYQPSFSREEQQLLQREAERYGLSITQLIHDVALAYLKQTYVVPGQSWIAEIEILLAKAYSEIQTAAFQIAESKRLPMLTMMRSIENMERSLRQCLYEPSLVENALRAAIVKQPNLRSKLLFILNMPDV